VLVHNLCWLSIGLVQCRALVLLLAGAPAEAAAILAPEVYSSHVDMYQRLLVSVNNMRS